MICTINISLLQYSCFSFIHVMSYLCEPLCVVVRLYSIPNIHHSYWRWLFKYRRTIQLETIWLPFSNITPFWDVSPLLEHFTFLGHPTVCYHFCTLSYWTADQYNLLNEKLTPLRTKPPRLGTRSIYSTTKIKEWYSDAIQIMELSAKKLLYQDSLFLRSQLY